MKHIKQYKIFEDLFNLERFLDAQESTYQKALQEIKNGYKESHWIWFIFPQIKGLGYSDKSIFYGLKNIEEANAYLNHPILGERLLEICNVLINLDNNDAYSIFGSPDNLKLKSCLTLFSQVENTNEIFDNLLSKFFNGKYDKNTLDIIDSL